MVAEACQVLEEFKQLAGWRRNSVLDSFQRFSKIWIGFCQAASRQCQYQLGSQQFNCSVGLLFGLHHLRCKHIFRFILVHLPRRRHRHHQCRFIVPSTCLNLKWLADNSCNRRVERQFFLKHCSHERCHDRKTENRKWYSHLIQDFIQGNHPTVKFFKVFPQQNWSSILPFLLRDALGP